jgi:hypothetical protein
VEERTEVLLHTPSYIGVPLIREAMLTASRVCRGAVRRSRLSCGDSAPTLSVGGMEPWEEAGLLCV